MRTSKSSSLLYECPAETRLTVYRRFSVKSNTKTVAKRKSRRPRTTVLLTMINMFFDVIASLIVLGNDIISLRYTLRLLIKIVRPQNDRAISEFYPHEVFPGG